MVEWHGTVVLRTPRLLLRTFRRDDDAFLGMCGLHHQELYPDDVEVAWRLRRLGMVFDHRAEIEDMGQIFRTVVYAITAEQWRSGAAARRRGSR